jgi:drug/metabolite transporter (DMT)-like permease
MKTTRILLAGIAVVLLWASAFPAIRVASPGLGPIGLSFARLVVAAIALLVLSPFLHVRLPARRDIPLILACAFFGMTAYQLLLNTGELFVPAGTSSIIVAAAPLVSAGIAVFAFRERLGVVRIVGSILAVGGVLLVCLARAGLTLSASVWIVVAAMIVQGIYHPLSRSLLRRYSALEVATYAMVAGTLMTLPFVPFGWDRIAQADAPAWLAAVYLGVLPSAVGFVLWGYAVARLPVVTSTSLLYLVPAVAVLISFIWLGEIPIASELLGGLIVIVGVIGVSQGDRITVGMRRLRRRKGIDPTAIEPKGDDLHEPDSVETDVAIASNGVETTQGDPVALLPDPHLTVEHDHDPAVGTVGIHRVHGTYDILRRQHRDGGGDSAAPRHDVEVAGRAIRYVAGDDILAGETEWDESIE